MNVLADIFHLELLKLIRFDVGKVIVRKGGIQGQDQVRHEFPGRNLRKVSQRGCLDWVNSGSTDVIIS